MFLWKVDDLPGFILVKEPNYYSAETGGMGGKADGLAHYTKIEHEPIAEFGGSAPLVIPGIFQFTAQGDQYRCINNCVSGWVPLGKQEKRGQSKIKLHAYLTGIKYLLILL